ncbi:MAG TPA: glycosyltransferase family 4 protein [Ktedonobacterales bacterium]|nr:glycosyltransferase family 4 protein [Ktedonobacterales bacterium]
MRILMLAQFYHPIIGGEERYVYDLSHHLVSRGHDVAVATLRLPETPEYAVEDGVRVYRIRSTTQSLPFLYKETARQHLPPVPDPGAMRALKDVVRRERPAIVHAHNWIVHSYVPLSGKSGARLVLSLHDYGLVCAKKTLLYHGAPCSGPAYLKCLACAREQYGWAKGAVTVTGVRARRHAEHAAVDLFLPVSNAVASGCGLVQAKAPFRVIPNFVPDDLVDGQQSRDTATSETDTDPHLAMLPQEPYILFVGDQTYQKGVPVLLEAYSRLTDAPPLVLIGRQFEDVSYKRSPGVMQLGLWPHEAVIEAWRRSMLGVLASVSDEPFGIAIIEAMAAGKPVVASRAGGLADIVLHERTGLLVKPNDAEDLARALQRLISDPELRTRMGQEASRRAENYKVSNVVPHIEQAYHDVLDGAIAGLSSDPML